MKQTTQDSTQLRREAEAQLVRAPEPVPEPCSAEELLHELQVHQIELEMQNEQLRQSQFELEKSRDRYVDFYDFAPVGYLTLDHDGMIAEINLTGAALLGVERNKLTRHNFALFVAPEDRDNWHRHLQDVLAHDEALAFELALQRQGGAPFYARLDCLHLKDNGKNSGVRIVLTDITERMQLEAARLEALDRFQKITRLVPGVVYQFRLRPDGSYCIPYASDSFHNIFRIDAAEVCEDASRVFAAIHPDDLESVMASIRTSAQNLSLWRQEFRLRFDDGTLRWLFGSSLPQREAGGSTLWHGYIIDITERKAAEEAIRNLAFYDPLTRLPNRRLLMDRLQHALDTIDRSGRKGALLFIDLDNFKALNDTLGHDTGDSLLQQVAQRLESCVREGDTVARLGGDEFVVMMEALGEKTLEAAAETRGVAEKILAALNQPYQLATHEYHNTSSIGATLLNGSASGAEELLKQADIAMYQAKNGGRNTLRFFDPKMQEAINARATLENALRNALLKHEFRLHYQIQVDGSHHVLGAEALIRWINPERGLVLPAQFIPLTEENGMILPIGQWVLEVACAQLKTWQQDLLTRDLVLSVNVSARQFRHPDFVAQVQSAVQRHAINPRLLKLELTESLLLENIEEVIATMNALNGIGIRLSLDDFGTGYSSLQYFKRLPLDQVKIDQSFVHDITTNNSDQTIVQTIISMAQNLDLAVIAEGVETEAQSRLLLGDGCTQQQGYLHGKPVPIEQFEAALRPVLSG